MSYTIAVAGKGGVGKTSIAGLVVTRLIAQGHTPVLAVDADPNTCLDEVLGVKVMHTIGRVREEARAMAGQGLGAGISKQELLEMRIAESLVEAQDFDLIAMGRCEGPGCYCYANNVLKAAIGQVADSYPYMVIDNEAGLENLSRRIVRAVDLLILVADPSKRGIATLGRLYELAQEMGIAYGQFAIVINRVRASGLPADAEAFSQSIGADLLVTLPENEELATHAEDGAALLGLSPANPVVHKVDQLVADALRQHDMPQVSAS